MLPGNADRKNREEDEGLGRGDFVTRPEKLLGILSEGGLGTVSLENPRAGFPPEEPRPLQND